MLACCTMGKQSLLRSIRVLKRKRKITWKFDDMWEHEPEYSEREWILTKKENVF